ncbi:MAG TPA: AraC family transcriptional regulator, partial [Polyangia bacterium]
MADTLLTAVSRFADTHADAHGVAATPLPGLTTIRADRPGELQFAISRPLVALVVQGNKRVMSGNQTFDFGAGDAMVIAADVPTVSQVTRADAGAPYFSLVLDLVPEIIASLTLEMDVAEAGSRAPIRIERTEAEVADTALRLMRLVDRPAASAILGTPLVREMHYWLLAGR